MSVSEKIFQYNFNEKRHSHVWKNVVPIQPWMRNIISPVEQRGKICVKYRITFYKTIKTRDLYDNPVPYISELKETEQEEHDLSHEADVASASNIGTKIIERGLQATRESPT